jgi:Na+/H+ antiporter NhaB
MYAMRPRLIAHPVMGWYVIILLATIVAVPPVYFLLSPIAAQWVSIGGVVVALHFGLGCVAWDYIVDRR